MKRTIHILTAVNVIFSVSCASLSISGQKISLESLEKISFYSDKVQIKNTLGEPTTTADHDNGQAWYYDQQMGHHEMPLAKLTLNKNGLLIGKTWYCHNNCNQVRWTDLKKRYPANTFSEVIPNQGRKSTYGPTERIYLDKAQGLTIEVDDNEIIAINWDRPESNYLFR